MKKIYPVFCLTFVLFACSDSPLKKVEEWSEGAERFELCFFISEKDGQKTDTFTKKIKKQTAKDFLDAVSRKSAPDYPCQPDGVLKIYEKGKRKPLKLQFNLKPSCAHIRFEVNGYAYSRFIEKEGIEQLQAYQ